MSKNSRPPVSGLGRASSSMDAGDFRLPATLYYDSVAFYFEASSVGGIGSSSDRKLRAALQSLFSFFEAYVNQVAYGHADSHQDKLSQAEIDVLEEMETRLSASGDFRRQQRFYPLTARFLMLGHFLAGKKMDRGSKEWQSFEHAIELRHKWTHPKPPFNSDINDEEVWLAIESVYRLFSKQSELMGIENPPWFISPEKLLQNFQYNGVPS